MKPKCCCGEYGTDGTLVCSYKPDTRNFFKRMTRSVYWKARTEFLGPEDFLETYPCDNHVDNYRSTGWTITRVGE